MDTIIPTNQWGRDQAFEDLVRGMKCPFRTLTKTYGHEVNELMMPCDPKCMALINSTDKSTFGCLKLMRVNYDSKVLEIFSSGLGKKETE